MGGKHRDFGGNMELWEGNIEILEGIMELWEGNIEILEGIME